MTTPISKPRGDKDRPKSPKPMQFTERDGHILETIHAYEGVMADYQIGRLFFTGERQLRTRLGLLWQHGYLARAKRWQKAKWGFMVYWLDKRGAEYVAGLSGIGVKELGWKKEPRESLILHDLTINDFRLDVMDAVKAYPQFQVEKWIPSDEFWAYPDTIEYTDKNDEKVTKKIMPDGLFAVIYEKRRFRFLLEIDLATEDNHRFVRQKIAPGIAYVKSKVYFERFGSNVGRWLVITTSEPRLMNMKHETERAAGDNAALFYFTTFELIKPETVFTEPIWYRAGEDEPGLLWA